MAAVEEVAVVRCPSCGGLRGISARHARRYGRLCRDCERGRVVPLSAFHAYWRERFTMEEIRDMARALWG